MKVQHESRPARVLILNCVVQNGGDAAILYAVLGQVRRAFGDDTEITAFDMNPAEANRLYSKVGTFLSEPFSSNPGRTGVRRRASLAGMVMSTLVRSSPLGGIINRVLPARNGSVQALLDADAIVATGGTYLVDHYDLKQRIFSFFLARLTGKPTYLFTQSMGPFQKKYIRRYLPIALRNVKHVFLRDERSLGYLRNIMPRVSATVCHDVVFDLAHPSKRETASPPVVLVSVREWSRFGDRSEDEGRELYFSSIANAVTKLIRERGVRVRFVSTCQGLESYRFDDSAVASQILDRIPEDCRSVAEVDSDFHRPDELVDLLSTASFVISTRMHMAILSMNHELPVFAVAYEFKTEELFANLGIGECHVDIAKITPDKFSGDVMEAFDRRDEIQSTLRKVLPAVRRSAATPLDALRETASKLGFRPNHHEMNE
ncbi:MAG: polysaccharide pyruvyl transferase family protein [Planctomycetota bacterium]